MGTKIRIAVLFGGRSAEHEVSIQSAKNVYNALDKNKYDVTLIGISKEGRWYLNSGSKFLLGDPSSKLLQTIDLSNQELGHIDVVFPILHGPYGEDGTVQGLLKLMNIPFVGASVLGSALGMDKDVMKRLLQQANIPVAKFFAFTNSNKINFRKLAKELGLPFFIKPANLGSSVGVNKVKNQKEFEKALDEASQYDNKILVEEYIKGREIECSVLGNENPIASIPGEVIVNQEFYSYNAKYIDESGAVLEIPAKLPKDIIKKIQELAVKTFKTLCCEGMGRVDFFLTKDDKIFVNEINTIPGFTNISMYPKLWEASGIPYNKLIDKLIELALQRHQRDQRLKTSK